eukprot:SAG22_NODE_110_length_19679_cov_45.046527_20_plen_344_part_00
MDDAAGAVLKEGFLLKDSPDILNILSLAWQRRYFVLYAARGPDAAAALLYFEATEAPQPPGGGCIGETGSGPGAGPEAVAPVAFVSEAVAAVAAAVFAGEAAVAAARIAGDVGAHASAVDSALGRVKQAGHGGGGGGGGRWAVELKGRVAMPQCAAIYCSSPTTFEIEVSGGARLPYQLRAESPADALAWVHALRSAAFDHGAGLGAPAAGIAPPPGDGGLLGWLATVAVAVPEAERCESTGGGGGGGGGAVVLYRVATWPQEHHEGVAATSDGGGGGSGGSPVLDASRRQRLEQSPAVGSGWVRRRHRDFASLHQELAVRCLSVRACERRQQRSLRRVLLAS